MIPRLTDIMDWVKGEMDEMEREEFFRVKKVVEKKKKRMQAELDQQLKEALASGKSVASPSKGLVPPLLSAISSKSLGGGLYEPVRRHQERLCKSGLVESSGTNRGCPDGSRGVVQSQSKNAFFL